MKPNLLPLKTKQGFTLVELLVVIAIIAGLSSLVAVAVNGAMKKAISATAKKVCSDISMACSNYYDEYHYLPANSGSPPSSDSEVQTDDSIMSILAGYDIDNLNPKERAFFSGKQAKGSNENSAYDGLWTEGNSAALYDPWKKPAGKQRAYSIYLDYDYDERLDNPFSRNKKLPGYRIISWSTGRDGEVTEGAPAKIGKNKDNVYSWQ